MSASTAPLSPAPEAAQASPPVAPGPQLACDRCGTFVASSEVSSIGPRRVCRACAAVLRKEIKLYPYAYVLVMGLLGNFAIAAVLSALNWRRLGDKERTRISLVVAGLGLVWIVALLWFDLGRLGFPANIGGTLAVTNGFNKIYAQHRKEGGARANMLWPVLILIGLFALAVAGYVGYAMATGNLEADG